jgi:hypothetical protein
MPTRSLLPFGFGGLGIVHLSLSPGAKFRVFSVFNFSKLFNKFEN